MQNNFEHLNAELQKSNLKLRQLKIFLSYKYQVSNIYQLVVNFNKSF